MENISQWVGIDVSKATLDVYIRPIGKALVDIEEHIKQLDERLEKLNQDIEQLTQNNTQWIDQVNLLKTKLIGI